VQERVDVPGAGTVVRLNEHMAPEVPVVPSVTVPLNPLMGITLMVEVPVLLGFEITGLGVADIEKSEAVPT